MMDQHETLSTFAEIAVAIAGFSGIVIAFGRRSLGSLTQLELRRLSNLFAMSGFVMFSTLLSISLLYLESLEATWLWRGQSALVVLLGAPWLIIDWQRVRRLEALERAQVKATVIYPFNGLAVIGLALQLANLVWFVAPWPFYVALVIITLFAFQQFILLVRMGFRSG
jgi:uncharacterized membrane protein